MKGKMKLRLPWCILFSCLILGTSSCVSSKKYKALQSTNLTIDQANKDYQEKLKATAAKNDSLQAVIVMQDSIIDSLTIRIAEMDVKKEKPKVVASSKKTSSLSKDQEYDKKSQFIYNFAAYIEWPVVYNGTEFVIGVEGDKDVLKKIENVIGNKKVGGKTVRVEKYNKVTKYHLVYITSPKGLLFNSIRNEVKKNKTVIICDDAALSASGAHISFMLDDDKVKYTINKPSIDKIGLKRSQELMRFSE